ncbi:MAG: hypothetical protein ABSE82_08225 [Nitrososphaerales archaeon]
MTTDEIKRGDLEHAMSEYIPREEVEQEFMTAQTLILDVAERVWGKREANQLKNGIGMVYVYEQLRCHFMMHDGERRKSPRVKI